MLPFATPPVLSPHSHPCCSDKLIDTIFHLPVLSEKESEPHREAAPLTLRQKALWSLLKVLHWEVDAHGTTQQLASLDPNTQLVLGQRSEQPKQTICKNYHIQTDDNISHKCEKLLAQAPSMWGWM